MVLVSPGVEVTVIDESIYSPSAAGTVPFVLIATAQDKQTAAGDGIADGTTLANAGGLYEISSQRELTATFGSPLFYQSTAGSSLHGYELNEYGLLAAYSLLGISNRCYVQRADVDLAQLVGGSRPTGDPTNGTIWLNPSTTDWGLHQWNAATEAFTDQTIISITSTNDLTGGVPKISIGDIGDYAVVATDVDNPVYYKNRANQWVKVGDAAWMISWPTISGTANATTTTGAQVDINAITVTTSGGDANTVASDINTQAITGITAAVVDNVLEIYSDDTATFDGSTVDAGVLIANGGVGDFLGDFGITAGTYYRPAIVHAEHYNVPQWSTSAGDTILRPTGSVWIITTSARNGASFDLSVYNSTTDLFVGASALLYENDWSALNGLDSSGGGLNLSANTYYIQYDVDEIDTATYKLFKRFAAGVTTVTGDVTNPVLTANDTFNIQASAPGSTALTTVAGITLSGVDAASLVADILAENIDNVTARVEATGAVTIEHTAGGVLVLKDTLNTPLADAGFTTGLSSGQIRAGNDSDLILSNWVAPTYTASTVSPSTDPADLAYWYFTEVDDVDIMMHDGSNWQGYKNVTNDARGYDLSLTDPEGPLVAASEPLTQSDSSALVYGDIWIDTSDLENYPIVYRWEVTASGDDWVLIDNAAQDTQEGILFADARFMADGTTDVVTGDLPSIVDLQTNNYLDVDAPDAALYPRGMLLFNTRRSGYNVKQYRTNYFNAVDFPSVGLPTEKNAWVTASGLELDGSPKMGRKAQRAIIVAALQASIDTALAAREDIRVFNLIATPGYPELIDNMVALNTDRRETAFVVGDTPFRLEANSTDLSNWATSAGADGETGTSTASPYLGIWYPSGLTNDLSGNQVVVPPSHMVLRGLARNDDVAFPWFAPAGLRRGIVDNSNALGYIDPISGEFIISNIRESLRDTLYTNNINPITNIPVTGIVLYGNKTRQGFASALDRVNVARLVVHLRRQLDLLAKPFVFEPNDKLTRDEIKQVVEQELNDLIAKRAILDYLVVCDETNNTPARIDRNELYVDVAIEPVKAVEFIYIPLRIKNTGEIAGII